MRPIKVTIPVPKLKIQIERVTLNVELPKLSRPRLPRPVYYSVALHAILLLCGAGLNLWQEHLASLRPKLTEIDMAFVPMPAGAGQGDAIVVGGHGGGAGHGLSNLLKQAMAGVSGKARPNSAQGPTGDSKLDLSQVAEGLKEGLLSGVASLAPSAQAAVASGSLQRTLALPMSSIANTKNKHPMTVDEKEAIRKAIAAREEAFRTCQERGLLVDNGLSGQVTLLFSVASAGKVSDTQVKFEGRGDSASRQSLVGCLKAESAKVSFPASTAGNDIRFSLLLR